MNTAGTGLVFTLVYAVTLLAGIKSVEPLLSKRITSLKALPVGAVALWLAVAIPSLLQIQFPGIYDALHRSRHDILQHHQWWRVVTSIMVQDGGLMGTASNLIVLAIAAYATVELWGSRIAIGLFLVAGIGLNVMATAFNATDGGGNSGATLTLVASLPIFGYLTLKGAQRRGAAIGSLVVAAAGLFLVSINDGHGIAILFGLIGSAALGMCTLPRPRRTSTPSSSAAHRAATLVAQSAQPRTRSR